MASPSFSRRTAIRGLLTGAAAVSVPKVLKVASSRRVQPAATSTAAAGRGWLSGAGDGNSSHIAGGGFGTWRGEPSTYARIWADASIKDMAGLYMMDVYKSAGWTGILDVACGGPRDGHTWASAASGSMDALWRSQCQTILAKWGKITAVHLSMSHELNGNWYPWSVATPSVGSFKDAWQRWYNIVNAELVAKGKNAKVVLSLNSDTVSSLSLMDLLPDTRYFNMIGVDFYSMWPDLTTQSIWNFNRLTKENDGAPRGIQSWFDFARSLGKPISFPEWGINSQSNSDNPFFIQQMRDIFAANDCGTATLPGPGQVAGESYFNTIRCRLYPDTIAPKAAAMYKSLRFGS